MCCFQEYMLLLLLILFSSLPGKHSTHPRTLKTSMGHFQDPKIDTSLKSQLAGTKMWVTQREDLLQKLKQQTNKPPPGDSHCPRSRVSPQWSHADSPSFLSCLRLVISSLRHVLLSEHHLLSLPWLGTRTSYLGVFGLVPPMWLAGESSINARPWNCWSCIKFAARWETFF